LGQEKVGGGRELVVSAEAVRYGASQLVRGEGYDYGSRFIDQFAARNVDDPCFAGSKASSRRL